MARHLPWFKFYVRDWFASDARRQMTALEGYVYLNLLFYAYDSGGAIPTETEALLDILPRTISREQLEDAWPSVSAKLFPHPQEPNAMANARVLEVIEEQRKAHKQRKDASKLGVQERQRKRLQD